MATVDDGVLVRVNGQRNLLGRLRIAQNYSPKKRSPNSNRSASFPSFRENVRSGNESPFLHAQNWNWHCANDCVAVYPQVPAIRVALGTQQIRLCLLHSLAQYLRHVTTADEYVRVYAHVAPKLGEMLGGVTDKLLLPLVIDIGATGTPEFHRSSNVGKGKTGVEFAG